MVEMTLAFKDYWKIFFAIKIDIKETLQWLLSKTLLRKYIEPVNAKIFYHDFDTAGTM